VKQIGGKQFAKILEKRGWILRRTTGSHHVYGMAGKRERISVPIHGNKPLKIGLLRHFLKLAEIDESEL
jgi:predicted RNA binding protein YcfA (HicA-like mRNA interferase family)